MKSQALRQLSDGTLRHKLDTLVANDRTTTAQLLLHIGEFDARRLYAADGFASMHAYCVQRLRFSDDVAFKRIRAARAARKFPAILAAIGDGRLHLTAVVMLSKYLNRENARELLQAATHKTKAEIELLIAQRFPQPDLPSRVRALPVAPKMEVVPEPVETSSAADAAGSLPGQVPTQEERSASDSPGQQVPEPVTHAKPHRIAPLAPRRFALQTTISQETHDKLRRIQDLLGHSLPSGDVAEVLDRAFDALLQKLEKAKFAATDHPRKRPAPHSANPRYIPANVKREVWKRDEGRCTHVGEGGERCSARRFLEFDHVLEVSRGGKASVGEIRLLCRTHNQYAAERAFGLLFMRA